MNGESVAKTCAHAAHEMRKDMLKMALKAGSSGAHLGGSFSAAEILAVLYKYILKYDVQNPLWEERDRLILSKGHCVMTQYAAMKQAGFISSEELDTFEEPHSWLYSHAVMNDERGIEFSTGSLGQGLSMGIGVALALKRKKISEARVFVLMGDGECDEGQVWEAAMSAPHFKLDNLVAIIDANGLQSDGYTSNIMDLGDLSAKFRAFGWNAIEVDGHNPAALHDVFIRKDDVPLAIIAKTTKGKGVSFMENATAWHHGRIGRKQFDLAMAELENNQ